MPALVQPDDRSFERSFKSLTYVAAPRATITVGTYDAEYQICQVGFTKRDGSLYVSFPYLATSGGLLSIADFPKDQSGSVTLSFGKEARATSHLAKYSHHPDGLALFSQDSKIRSEVRRQSFRLDGPIGHIFQLSAYHTYGFERFDPAKRKRNRVYLRNIFREGLPHAVQVRGEWRRKQSIVDNIEPAGKRSGPISNVKYRNTGDWFTAHFLGEPDNYPLKDHVFMLTVGPTTAIDTITEPSVIFLGGYDHHEVVNSGIPVQHTSCLIAMYPGNNHGDLEAVARSIDLN